MQQAPDKKESVIFRFCPPWDLRSLSEAGALLSLRPTPVPLLAGLVVPCRLANMLTTISSRCLRYTWIGLIATEWVYHELPTIL